jgi:hypothetical protein
VAPRRWIAEWDWPSDAGSSVLSGEPARPISARQCTRVALLSSLVSRERPRITSHEQAAVHRLAEHGHVPRWALNSVVVALIGCPLGCHASDLRSTDASASNVSSGHSVRHPAGSPHRTSAASLPSPFLLIGDASTVEREAHDVSARLLTEAGRGVSKSVGNHLRMHRTDIGPYSQPTERPPASTQPPCGGTRPVMSYASPLFS